VTEPIKHNSAKAKAAFLLILAFLGLAAFYYKYHNPRQQEAYSLNFEWNEPQNLAVFERGKYLWLIFEKNLPYDLDSLKQQGKPFLKEIIQLPNAQALILRLRPVPGFAPLVRRDGNHWKIDFYQEELPFARAETPIALRHTPDGWHYLFFPGGLYGKVISLTDPEIGDNLMVLTSSSGLSPVNYGYQYPDLEILPSFQGIGLVLNRDDLYSEKTDGGIAVKAYRNGLHIAPDLAKLRQRRQIEQTPLYWQNMPEFLETVRGTEDFAQRETDLSAAVLQSLYGEKTEAELQLAGYYLSVGLPVSAAEILNKIFMRETNAEKLRLARRLKGLSDFLYRRYASARQFFSGSHPDDALWLALIAAAEEPANAQTALAETELAALSAYPPAVQAAVAVAVLPSVIRFGKEDEVTRLIIYLRKFPRYTVAADYFTARNLEKQGKNHAAEAFYQKVLSVADSPYSLQARFRLVLLDKDGTPEKRLQELEQIYLANSDKLFRRNVLLLQAEIYLRQGQSEKALEKLTLLAEKCKMTADVENKAVIDHIKYAPLQQLYMQIINNGIENE